MQILRLIPAAKDYIWGGTRLRDEYGVPSESERVAEGWVLSCYEDAECVISGGTFDGKTLSEVLELHPGFMGRSLRGTKRFPLLVKLIDAREELSLQVHPDDEYALEVEGEPGKNELWYIIDCDEGASIVNGFEHELTREEFRRAIVSGTLTECVNRLPVKKGDVFLLEAGTLHTIGGGVLVAEIQQSSDTTYRVYDHDRTDAEGNPRELSIEKALDVTITLPPTAPPGAQGEPCEQSGFTRTLLGSCEGFTAELLEGRRTGDFEVGEDSFAHVLVTRGKAELRTSDCSLILEQGGSAFIPAGAGTVHVTGDIAFIKTTV